ncbi:hypothetical protein OIU80_06420 [Flavobacterium sp. LS1R47]|uniref:Leucine-rich repeat domain-containing protein n=1 Tax=Flavobacterium frigoritolerans TaxID=2987686 RepID=A0A9X2ZLC0_9FLAO|nr:hypothetical protein [Flavobacterium frigoritolerans]MCV9931912.1 hypothetical protein [Flavobacterium frigoritolerans]
MFRIEEKKPHAKKVITIFTNEFELGIEEAIKNDCDGIFLRRPLNNTNISKLDIGSIEKISSKCIHISFEEGFAENYDVEVLEKMKELKQLWLPKNFKFFDLSTLNNLEQLTLAFPSKFLDLSKLLKLKSLYLRDEVKDLSIFNFPENINEIIIANSKIKNLDGLEKIKSLQVIELSSNKSLQSIECINKLKIEKLKIISCTKITDLNILKHNLTITNFYIDKLNSIDIFKPMNSLKFFGFQDLKDGNVESILQFPSIQEVLFYPNKKHYTHKEVEINSLIKDKK